jgi:hypothetical protein
MALRDLIGIPGIQGVNPAASDIARLTAPSAMPTAILPVSATAQPTLSPTAKYIADMQALIRGGIGPLSTGEKISALGQVLQAAGSRGASDPAAVLQNVRNQQMQKLNAQFQIAQLQKKTLEEEDFIKTLTPSERNMFAILDETGRRQFMVARQQGRELTDAEKKIQAAGIPLESPEAQRILRNVAAEQGVITVTGPSGTTYIQASDLMSGGGAARGAAQTIPQAAVDALRAGKGTVAEFESMFGKGTAAQYLGGGSGNTTGGFRGR